MTKIKFDKRESILQIEEGYNFCPKFNNDGLIPCITIESETQKILMFSYMNEIALKTTLNTNFAHYWSRSRNSIWKKGEVSGMQHSVKKILIDDDQDSIILEVSLTAPKLGGRKASCHVGYHSCFYRELQINKNSKIELKFIENQKSFDPKIIYKNIENPTKI